MIQVALDGSGQFSTIQKAVDSIDKNQKEPTIIKIKNGVYRERVWINQNHIHLEGEDKDKTIVVFGDYANEILEDQQKRGTFRTPSVFIDADNFSASKITFSNDAGLGKDVGQALALYVEGDRIAFYDCNMLGSQDTLFTAPLPTKAYEKNGFRGPKEFAPRRNGRHYYKNCFIRGDIDFIFGGATAYFEECELFSQDIKEEVNGYVTAASTTKGQKYGYVFNRCIFSGNCRKHSVYLGRPWRNFAKTVIMNSRIDSHICPEGWHDWNKTNARETVFYGEYNNFGESADFSYRPDWIHQLTEEEALDYQKDFVLWKDFL